MTRNLKTRPALAQWSVVMIVMAGLVLNAPSGAKSKDSPARKRTESGPKSGPRATKPATATSDKTTSASEATTGTKFVPKATLKWRTESEENNYGFFIERSDSPRGPYRRVNKTKIISGHGTTNTPHEYRYADTNVVAGRTYYYRLFSISYQGEITRLGPEYIPFRVKTAEEARAKNHEAKQKKAKPDEAK